MGNSVLVIGITLALFMLHVVIISGVEAYWLAKDVARYRRRASVRVVNNNTDAHRNSHIGLLDAADDSRRSSSVSFDVPPTRGSDRNCSRVVGGADGDAAAGLHPAGTAEQRGEQSTLSHQLAPRDADQSGIEEEEDNENGEGQTVLARRKTVGFRSYQTWVMHAAYGHTLPQMCAYNVAVTVAADTLLERS